MNYEFRELVRNYAIAMMSERREISVPTIIFGPSTYMLYFLNFYFRVSWLYQPLPWSRQIRAEVRIRIQEMVQSSTIRINKIFAIHRRLDMALDLKIYQTAIDQAASDQTTLEGEISNYSFRERWFQNPKYLKSLRESLQLTKRILGTIQNTKRFLETYKVYTLELMDQLHILSHLDIDQLSILGSTEMTSIRHNSFDRLGPIDSARESAYIKVLKQSCVNDKVISTEQYPICLIDTLRTILSDVDNDNLGLYQRSWCMEQRNALVRYQSRDSTTLLARVLLQQVFDMYYEHGISIPAHAST